MDEFNFFDKTVENLKNREMHTLSDSATLSKDGARRRHGCCANVDYRQAFAIDADRIMHSSSYTRYIDKTQVFSMICNDHITHRALHVQLVSKIARTIGRFLFLNEDLIEAIALGHDIGHTPFGHDGEMFLSKLCSEAGIGNFFHNVQSVQFLDKVERKGRGWNLCLQTLDGILCHDGEIHEQMLFPETNKTFHTLEVEILKKTHDKEFKIKPMTFEGCVVRLADTISYIGRDLEDAIRLQLLKRSELPQKISNSIGNTNGTIVHKLVTDLIKNSYNKGSVGFSPEISHSLKSLKTFNMDRIYTNPKIKKHNKVISKLFKMLFETSLEDLETNNISADIFSKFLLGMSLEYRNNHENYEIVRDYIAGMTDRYFLSQFNKKLRPKMLKC